MDTEQELRQEEFNEEQEAYEEQIDRERSLERQERGYNDGQKYSVRNC